MPAKSHDELLLVLEQSKTHFDNRGRTEVKAALSRLSRIDIDDAEELIRFHEVLLFLRAHPHDRQMLAQVDRILASFVKRVERLATSGADLTAFDYIEYSGIAGTAIVGHFSYDIARWLASRFPRNVEIAWERHERKDRLGSTMPRFLPLLEEDALVEANIPYRSWITAGQPRGKRDLVWLLERFDRLNRPEREKAELYDSLELWIRWSLGNTRASRTRNMSSHRRPFFHRGSMIGRREVSLENELAPSPLAVKVSAKEGLKIIDTLRATTTVRYRELYGITHGDPTSVVRVDAGRGVEIFLWGLPPERRLPLRAYHLGFTLKNGVPINYIEGINLCGKMEVGFNTFYTFREGESAWVYAQVLRVLHHHAAAECFSIDPYQLGLNNEEAIESGAFWFYRKLGFRSTSPKLAALTIREEKKIAAQPAYRTGPTTLRRLASANAVYEVARSRRGEWDDFVVRNLGLAVNRRMAVEFGGDGEKIRASSIREVTRALGCSPQDFEPAASRALGDLSLVLGLLDGLEKWSLKEKKSMIAIIRAKMAASESRYSKLLQGHERLRKALLALGSDFR